MSLSLCEAPRKETTTPSSKLPSYSTSFLPVLTHTPSQLATSTRRSSPFSHPKMESNNLDNDASTLQLNACSYCSKAVDPDGEKLKRCSRCLRTAYCNADCQTAHWKGGHKQVCGKSDQQRGPAFRKKVSLPSMRTLQEPELFGFTDITITIPSVDDVSGCCAFCAILTLVEGDNQMFFVPEPISMTRLNGGVEPYPANKFKLSELQFEQSDLVPYPEPKNHYTRRTLADGTSVVGCCRHCAHKFREVIDSGAQISDSPVIAKHIDACSNLFMLYGPNNQLLAQLVEAGLPALSVMDRRLVSIVNLYSHPDLTKVTILVLLII